MNKRHTRTDANNQEAAPMEQVRELLFGAQLKDMETKMQRQEERFSREINDAKESLKKRLDSLENFMKSEVSSMLSRLKEEQQERDASMKAESRERAEALQAEARERQEAFKNEQRERKEAGALMNKELANTVENFDRKLAKVAANLDTAERELRQLLLSESGSLSDKIENKYQDALNVLAKTASQIRADMVYRTALSGIFTEAVMELNTPWQADNPSGNIEDETEAASVSEE